MEFSEMKFILSIKNIKRIRCDDIGPSTATTKITTWYKNGTVLCNVCFIASTLYNGTMYCNNYIIPEEYYTVAKF